jgi:ADP-ribosyl-[dinitrogen reductase] hydrolase
VTSDRISSRVKGALLGGALGDALVDALRTSGPAVRVPGDHDGRTPHETSAPGGGGGITACTQLVLFTADALLRAGVELERTGTCLPPALLFEAYQGWLEIQGGSPPRPGDGDSPDWLQGVELLAAVRRPDATTLEALRTGRGGRLSMRVNEASDAGALPRAVPAGFLVPGLDLGASASEAYYAGSETASVTHGDDVAISASGALAATIAGLMVGHDVAEAAEVARGLSPPIVADALERSQTNRDPGSAVAVQIGEQRGGHGSALEALELALGCARLDTFEEAMDRVASLPGDARAIGSICGSLIGARDGVEAMPTSWLAWLDGRSVVEEVADDCVEWLRWLEGPREVAALGAAWLDRYG